MQQMAYKIMHYIDIFKINKQRNVKTTITYVYWLPLETVWSQLLVY